MITYFHWVVWVPSALYWLAHLTPWHFVEVDPTTLSILWMSRLMLGLKCLPQVHRLHWGLAFLMQAVSAEPGCKPKQSNSGAWVLVPTLYCCPHNPACWYIFLDCVMMGLVRVLYDFLGGIFMKPQSSGPGNFCSTCVFQSCEKRQANAPHPLMGVESLKKETGEEKDIRNVLPFVDGKLYLEPASLMLRWKIPELCSPLKYLLSVTYFHAKSSKT